jgi:hypothetical protein
MYIIELVKDGDVIGLGMIEKGNIYSWTAPTQSGYQYCSKFHDKGRALKAAAKIEAKYHASKKTSFKEYVADRVKAEVVPEFGGPTRGEKGSVGEKKKDKIRR